VQFKTTSREAGLILWLIISGYDQKWGRYAIGNLVPNFQNDGIIIAIKFTYCPPL
jgi:hypothetical protein